jgi:hypothetical protein
MTWTVGSIREILGQYPDNTPVNILFECPEALPKGWQYEVPVLDVVYTGSRVIFCHEEDFAGHYSKNKEDV